MRSHFHPSLLASLQFFAVLAAITLAVGCRPDSPESTSNTSKPTEQSPLRVLVVDDEPLGEAIARQWIARTESKIDVQHATYERIASAQRLPADVVVFPSSLLGQLAERGLIAPIPSETLRGGEFDERDVFGQVRMAEVRWGRQPAAVPLGSPQLLLAYREDLFEALDLQPPETWEDYQHLVEQLRDPNALGDFKPESPEAWQPTAEPLAPGWASRLLLARAAAYVTHRDQVAALFHPDTMAPLIAEPPFVQALEELASANKGQPERLTAAQTLEQLAAGKAGLAIGFPEAVAVSSSKSETLTKLRFAPLPGSAKIYNFPVGEWESRRDGEPTRAALVGIPGRQAAVSASAKQGQAALNFLVWLSSGEISGRTSPTSPATAPFRKSQLAETGRWLGLEDQSANSCAGALEQSLSQQRSVMSLRIPGNQEYLAALDEAVEAVVAGKQPSAEALKSAADKWEQITDRLGRDKQQLAYRRSLNVADWP